MAGKKSKNALDDDPIIPNDDLEMEEASIFEEEDDDSEDKGIDEILEPAEEALLHSWADFQAPPYPLWYCRRALNR